MLDTAPRGTPQDVEAAVAAAKAAFEGWRRTPANDRPKLLHGAAAKIRAHWG